MKVKILADSCSDIPESTMQEYDIGMVPLNIQLGTILKDRIEITPQEYYNKIDEYDLPITSSPNLAQWKESFDKYLQSAYDKIVVITLSSKLSNTHDQACVAAKKYYPNDVKILDSTQASAGEGLIAIKFRELLRDGYDFDTVYDFMSKIRHETILIGLMDTLKMLQRSGRISKASEFIATLGKMKPMVIMEGGELCPLCKVISLKNAKKRIISEINERMDTKNTYTLLVTHADGENIAYELKNQLEKMGKISKSFVNFMGPVVGSRVGLNAQIMAVIPDIKP